MRLHRGLALLCTSIPIANEPPCPNHDLDSPPSIHDPSHSCITVITHQLPGPSSIAIAAHIGSYVRTPFQMAPIERSACLSPGLCAPQLRHCTGRRRTPTAPAGPHVSAARSPGGMEFLERASRMLVGDACMSALQQPARRRGRHCGRRHCGTLIRADRQADEDSRGLNLYSSCADVAGPSGIESGSRNGSGPGGSVDGKR